MAIFSKFSGHILRVRSDVRAGFCTDASYVPIGPHFLIPRQNKEQTKTHRSSHSSGPTKIKKLVHRERSSGEVRAYVESEVRRERSRSEVGSEAGLKDTDTCNDKRDIDTNEDYVRSLV